MSSATSRSSRRKRADSATLPRWPLAVEASQQNRASSESAVQTAESGHAAARAKLEAARTPLNEADKRVQRLETEARTISKIVNGETKNLWPPIIDGITVSQGL